MMVFDKAKKFYSEHPYIVGGSVLAGVVVLIVLVAWQIKGAEGASDDEVDDDKVDSLIDEIESYQRKRGRQREDDD